MNNQNIHPIRITRMPACAGRFYPADPEELRQMVSGFLKQAHPSQGPAPKALIAPHAGYPFSGPVAGSAYAPLHQDRKIIRRIVIIGPSHYSSFRGLAIPTADAFASPLGEIPLDREALDRLSSAPLVSCANAAHEPEHCLEVQLPFLQLVLDEFTLVPILVGEASPEEIARVLDVVWGGPETRIVASSDLSHYHDYRTAKTVDAATAQAIETLCLEKLEDDQACGCRPVRGLLYEARKLGMRVQTVDLRNSGDTAGPRDRVVGYGAFSLFER